MSTWQEQLQGAHAEVINEFKKKWREISGGPSIADTVTAFLSAVDWTERWIWAVLMMHVALLVSVVLLRKKSTYQAMVFFSCMLGIYNAQNLNETARRHWTHFAGQDYFDASGIFVSTMFSGPLLLIMFFILLNYIWECSLLLVKMKRKELMWRARQMQKPNAAADQEKKKEK